MRKTLVFTLCCFALTALSAQKNCKTLEDNFYFTDVVAANKDEMLDCAGIFYERRFGSRSDLLPTAEAIDLMNSVISDLLQNEIEPSCNPGDPNFTGRSSCNSSLDGNGSELVSVNFRWPESNTGAYGKFIDFSTGEIGEDERNDPGLSFDVENCVDAKFFAMHSTCNSIGGAFYIIIVDKDLEFQHFPHGMPKSVENEKKKIDPSSTSTPQIRVYPNPISSDIARINVDLAETARFSATMYSGANKFIRTLSPAKVLEAGAYHFNFQLNDLVAGVYFLVTTVNGKRRVEKIVKI